MSNQGHIYGGQPEREKRYVDVVSLTTSDGLVTPQVIVWDDGRRYTIQVGGRQTYLWYDDYRHAWFVEAKHRPSA